MIYVLAGVDGAGKSSIDGSAIRARGEVWFNPDEFAQTMKSQFPDRPFDEINSEVWHEGHRRLQSAISQNTDFAFETTLGGKTITNTLHQAIATGVKVSIWYCGLESPELHIERVEARVRRGGHAIPKKLIRSRYESSMKNLCLLMPGVHTLGVYDNSTPLDSMAKPSIREVLYTVNKKIVRIDLKMPAWAKPAAAIALGWK